MAQDKDEGSGSRERNCGGFGGAVCETPAKRRIRIRSGHCLAAGV